MEPQETGVVDLPQRHTLKRKPVPRPQAQDRDRYLGTSEGSQGGADPVGPRAKPRVDVVVTPVNDELQNLNADNSTWHDTSPSPVSPFSTVQFFSHADTSRTDSTAVSPDTADYSGPTFDTKLDNPGKPEGPSKLAKAWEETKYFAGGLISHPVESTKHYSVLRHSLGVVYYQGPATSIAVSIFADRPLPADRKLWLQQKGWTGTAGWAAKQLFRANGGWLDVTPSVEATAEQLPASCERAWQRDCRKFLQKEGEKKGHQLRETCVVRIPCEAEDGYFRIVLCGDGRTKNKLCPSPVFRVASMNAAPSSIKGASLSTLPLEAGIKVLSIVANNAALNAVAPVGDVVTKAVGKYMPSFWAQEATSKAYASTGIQDKINNANETYRSVRDASYQHVGGFDERVYDALDRAPMVGDPGGPQAPYPFRISSTIVQGSGLSSQKRGIPTANLRHVREEVTMSLHGLYFGWARISPSKQVMKGLGPETSSFYPMWHPSIIEVSILSNAPATVTYGAQKRVSVHLIHPFPAIPMLNSTIEAIIMGFLRPHVPASKILTPEETERLAEQDGNDVIADIAITQASLARPAWAVEHTYRIKGWKMERDELDEQTGRIARLTASATDRYVDARQAAQRQIDRMPVHRVGVRREVDALKSKAIGTGGIYVRRQGLVAC